MLKHARQSQGEKANINVNSLAEEYLRLSYQAIRGKDNMFHVVLETDFDQNIKDTKVVSQDVGTVLLNLYNNAFFAVKEKAQMTQGLNQDDPYKPKVSVTTKTAGGKVEISVRDNGRGIPQHLINKIFQPFFTTKPAGQGTGLGLSLSYDIIKAHGGEILVESVEGEFTEFTVILPA
jgi:signal transduction histidine kinase